MFPRPVDLISKAYVQEQKILHARPNGYGGKGNKWAATVAEIATRLGCGSILDYGCGQGRLVASLKLMLSPLYRLDEYDPAIPGKDHLPAFADLVVCTDVLEHVETDCLDTVLMHLNMLARKAIFIVVATRPSNKELSDGRNAHLTVESAEWWQDRVSSVIKDMVIYPVADEPSDREWVAELRA